MDDILIISYQQSQVANLWVNYIKSCFDQICKQRNRQPFRVVCKGLEEVTGSMTLALEERLVRVKLQLVVVCPQFLQHISEQPMGSSASAAAALARLLQPERVLAMLLGVEEDAITEQQQAGLVGYQQWKKMSVRNQDEGFVGEFLNEAMAILARVTQEIQAARQEKAIFSVVPKKVKHGHNKVIVLLNEPLDKDDKVKVTINKNGEILEVPSVKRRNPFTLQFAMPDVCLAISMLVGVRVEKNGELLGSRQVKCESKMRELDSLLRSSDSPLDFMCQTLGFSGDREHLDSFLVSAFQRNLPQHFNLLRVPSTELPGKSNNCGEELPTLLHFAAKFGLEKLAWQLLECPGGDQACEMRNASDHTPADIADNADHRKLGAALRGFMQMNEFTTMYIFLKSKVEGKSTSKPPSTCGSEVREEVDYHRPRPPSETYQVPPCPRPVHLVTPEEDSGGYLEMHPSLPGRRSPIPTHPTSLRRSPKRDIFDTSPTGSEPFSHHFKGGLPAVPMTARSRENVHNAGATARNFEEETHKLHSVNGVRKTSREHLPSVSVQDELVEIISDFKNNVFTISEVEKLVESWRNRNDVQQSFKEKQDQLVEMRKEYERLQQKMKSDMKRATPFDRIKNFFKSSKSKDPESKEDERRVQNVLTTERASDVVQQRPASSLSVHSICSSSSSERMSTMSALSACSGASLGDSGTHSDPEEHKTLPPLRETPQSETPMPNYAVPPSPKPVHGARPRFSRNNMAPPTSLDLQSRPPMPTPRPYEDDDDSYIQPGEYNDSIFENHPAEPATPDYMNLAPPSDGHLPNYLNITPDSMFPAAPPVPPRR